MCSVLKDVYLVFLVGHSVRPNIEIYLLILWQVAQQGPETNTFFLSPYIWQNMFFFSFSFRTGPDLAFSKKPTYDLVNCVYPKISLNHQQILRAWGSFPVAKKLFDFVERHPFLSGGFPFKERKRTLLYKLFFCCICFCSL